MSERCQKLEGATGPRARSPLRNWSGRPDSNRRRPAWEAGILPLNYGRSISVILLQGHVVGLNHFVAARPPDHTLVDAVQIDLLVERHGRHLLDPELVDAVVLFEAFLLVHDRLRLVEHPVEVVV